MMETAPTEHLVTRDPNEWADLWVAQNGGDVDVMTAWFDAVITGAKRAAL
jgi:hypothetical protein